MVRVVRTCVRLSELAYENANLPRDSGRVHVPQNAFICRIYEAHPPPASLLLPERLLV